MVLSINAVGVGSSIAAVLLVSYSRGQGVNGVVH